ncbi:AAA family ATPase [Chryseobacterium aquaticum]|uniref:AAA family ATPase n=1 Tax=Chryseobacterium aquaticum TaxID=452084 RepID=A0A848N107_9FLAO|nr:MULTISPECIES: AAA family ATPase [Chryseobacterium]NMR34727.1 AAA family ATPase [Chryseobacterium aquaticum]NRQ46885.1 AAA family ATPase [Chryseobacterium sp. C-204]
MINVDFKKLKTSWTKYDIVLVMDAISSVEKIEAYKAKEIVIDESILRSFLGIKTLKDTIPSHWIEIQKYPLEKKLFALLSVLFTHGDIVEMFAQEYANERMGGLFITGSGKMYTNIRSALVESGAALSNYRREIEVPYDFSLIYKNGEVGKLFKQVIKERINRVSKLNNLSDDDFYRICYSNQFDKAISLSPQDFKKWLEGNPIALSDDESLYIKSAQISNFYSVRQISLMFDDSKEIYFLGENGDGKSLILMSLYLTFRTNFIRRVNNIEKIARIFDILKENRNFSPLGIDNAGKQYGIGNEAFLKNVFGYGTHRGRIDTDDAEEFGFMSLFDTEQKLINPVTWLSQQKALELEKSSSSRDQANDENSLLELSVDSLEKMLNDLLEREVIVKVEVDRVEFTEKGASPISFHQLSEGYKSVIIFVCDLIFRLSQSADAGLSINDLRGVVFVDEIDLHLHPKWQRVLIGKLRNVFPGIQFIFTTHSPTMIQGASEDAIIYRVYRDTENGITKVSDPYYRKNLDHLMINTVLTSPLFGLSNSRMNEDDDFADTSETYLLYRINKKLEEELQRQKAEGKEFIKDEEIDSIIDEILKKEIGKND